MSRDNAAKLIHGLYAIADTACIPIEDIPAAAGLIIKAGCKLIQLRAKGVSDAEFLRAAQDVRSLTSASGAIFIVNDSIDIALKSAADGLHVGQSDIDLTQARAALGEDAIIGVSTHNTQEATEAEAGGADYISFGPIFPTRTKPDADRPKGTTALTEIRKTVSLPIVAIGGITEENAPAVMRSGADACAIISDILYLKDISSKTVAIIAALSRSKQSLD